MPPELESEEYKTVSLLWDIGGWIAVVMDFVQWCWEFGKTDPIDLAMERIERELQEIYSRLDGLDDRIDELVDIVVRSENRARVRWLRGKAGEVTSLAFELRQDPGRAAVVAHGAARIADELLEDEDAWLWRDVLVRPRLDAYGEPTGETYSDPLPADFKVALALPVYVGALILWMAAISAHVRGDRSRVAPPLRQPVDGGHRQEVQAIYGAELERHIAATGVRRDWREGEPPLTLPEKVRSRISCRPVAHEKYARDGRCVFSIMCTNEIERTTTSVREISITVETGPFPVLCTIDPGVGLQDEREEEDGYPASRVLARMNEILRAMHATGQFPFEPFVGQFPDWQASRVAMYGLGPDHSVTRYTQNLTPAPEPWQGPEVLLAAVPHPELVAAGGEAILGQANSGEWLLYRAPDWDSPVPVGTVMSSTPTLLQGGGLPPVWRSFGGGYGVLYGLVAGRPNAEFSTGDLYWVRLENPSPGAAPTFSQMRKVGWGWDRFTHVFSAGDGVIYGVWPNGWLHCRKHAGWSDGSFGWDEPIDFRDIDWRTFARIVPAVDGLIYAMYPNGRLVCLRHKDHRHTGPTFEGPIDVGRGWDVFDQLVAELPTAFGGVQ